MKAKDYIFSKEMLCVLILLFLYCSILFSYLSKTSPKAVEQKKEVGVVQVVNASEPVVEKSYVDRFFDIVKTHESSNGTNKNPKALHNYCKSIGKWNEIGYSPKTKFCFGDEEEAKLFVAFYIKRNCEDKRLASCLCWWNTGTNVETCAYSNGDLGRAN